MRRYPRFWPFRFLLLLLAVTLLGSSPLFGCDGNPRAEGERDTTGATDVGPDGACIEPRWDLSADSSTDASSDAAEDPDDEGACANPDATSDPSMDTATDVSTDSASDAGDPPVDLPSDLVADVAIDPDAETDADAGADLDASDDPEQDPEPDSDAGSSFTCGGPLIDARDGAEYATVAIGSQCWMGENLDAGTMILASVAQQDNETIEKYCYGDNATGCASYGGLYQWDELMAYGASDAANPSTTRGICPAGWHVPSDAEWKALEMALGMSAADADLDNIWRGAGIGTALKVGGSSGFEALLAGRSAGSTFDLAGTMAYFYTSTESSTITSRAWRRCLSASANDIGRWDTFPKSYGFSLRCVLD